jgi:hypothetical protein
MAKLPDPAELQRVAPNPSNAVANYNPNASNQADIEAGNFVADLAARETNRLDELKAADAETELMRAELELGEEYKSVRGGDVLKPEFHKTFQQKYADRVSGIEGNLSTPAQKAKFQDLAKRRAVNFDAGRVSHAMGEAEQFEKNQHGSRIQVITDTAVSQYANPDVIAATSLQLESEIVKWGVRRGMGAEEAIAYTKEVKGNFYASVINKALIDNDMSTANSMFATAGGMLSLEQRRSISNQLTAGNAFVEGQTLAVAAQAMAVEGVAPAEIELFLANATTKEAYAAAQTIFGNMKQAADKEEKEAVGSVFNLYHETKGNNGIKRAAVLGSAEFRKLTPTQRDEVYRYLEADDKSDRATQRAETQFSWAAENQARTREERRMTDKFKTPEITGQFYKTIMDPTLKDRSRNEINALLPVIGPEKVKMLLAEKENQLKDIKPLAIDKTLLDAAMPPSLKKDKKAAEVDAYQGYVKEALIQWQLDNPGKTPTLEQTKAIYSSANAEYNVTGRLWDSTYRVTETPSFKGTKATQAETKRNILLKAAGKGIVLTPEEVDAEYQRTLAK